MNWKILYKYVKGDCDEEELRKVGVWLKKDPANEDFFISFIEEWSEEENIEFDTDARAAWDQFQKNNLKPDNLQDTDYSSRFTGQAIDKPYSIKYIKRGRSPAFWSYSAAAVMLLILALIFVIEQFKVQSMPVTEKESSYQEISTVRGQRTNLILSDGTKVILNSSSSLRIPKNYGTGVRKLYLVGEAFFEVKHDEEAPFIVVSYDTYTKDLGTQFNVTAYDSTSIEVAVKEGLVSMGRVKEGELQKDIVELTPNKLGVLKDVGGLTVSDIDHMDQYVGWTEGELAFRSAPFPVVLKRLERWFDIDCKVKGDASSFAKRTLTATYDNMPMSEVLDVLSISMDVSYTRQGRTITFYEGNKLKNKGQVKIN
ncbi:FecR domain-containing protein [Aliifodinibius sp. S!AR15-10]|uniref:FecR family protein n=1 Tax=Aliifodinibius sp. S!AR15-10 TaxID=2950437 RepID=UPI00285E7B7B|nr:FecR domain-containing protein [Aliifodinibius sp. S!AR15-10]MDR8389910.1 FecR domain-containing protein [Aliifodinibius sp. S!AR15-10]